MQQGNEILVNLNSLPTHMSDLSDFLMDSNKILRFGSPFSLGLGLMK
jgi:hypothetical protein